MKMNMHSCTQYYSNVDDAENSSCTVFLHLLWHCAQAVNCITLDKPGKKRRGKSNLFY